MIAREYGWPLEYVRNLDPITFESHMSIILIRHRLEYRQQAMQVVSGAKERMKSNDRKG